MTDQRDWYVYLRIYYTNQLHTQMYHTWTRIIQSVTILGQVLPVVYLSTSSDFYGRLQ